MDDRLTVALVVLLAVAWTQGLLQVKHLPVLPDQDFDGDGLDNDQERRLGTNSFRADTDGDGLQDWFEVSMYETDPTMADTDGDGFSDSVEIVAEPPIADADPLQRDVYVEIDYMPGNKPSRETLHRIAAAFANGPIQNPDGSTGIDLHFVVDDEIPAGTGTTEQDLTRIRKTHFDNASAGYHYAVFINDAGGKYDDRTGFYMRQNGHRQMAIAYLSGGYADTFMHELGHSLGIESDDYAGVDSHSVSANTYQSVMNYNYEDSRLELSRRAPFDDWEHINDSQINPEPRGLRERISRSLTDPDRPAPDD